MSWPYFSVPILSIFINTILIFFYIKRIYNKHEKLKNQTKNVDNKSYSDNNNSAYENLKFNLSSYFLEDDNKILVLNPLNNSNKLKAITKDDNSNLEILNSKNNNMNQESLKELSIKNNKDNKSITEDNFVLYKASNPASSLDKMLFLWTVIGCIIAISWLINIILFPKARLLKTRCVTCFFYSLITIFLFVFEWTFFVCCMINFRSVILNPMDERSFASRLKLYVFSCLIVSLVYTTTVFLSGIYGVSPMLTCFIKNNYVNDATKINATYFILGVPIIYIIYFIYIFINIFRLRKIIVNIDVKISAYKLLIYGIILIISYFPTIFLYLVTINKEISSPSFYSWLSYYCSLTNISVNLITGIGRALEYISPISLKNYIKDNAIIEKELFDNINKNSDNYFGKPSISLEDNIAKSDSNYTIRSCNFNSNYNSDSNNFLNVPVSSKFNYKNSLLNIKSNQILDNFLRDSVLAIIFTLNKSIYEVETINKCYMNKYIFENREFCFDTLKNPELIGNLIFSDQSYLEALKKYPITVNIIEHSPKLFKKLRDIDKVSEVNIISSLLTANVSSIKTGKGKSGALFLPTLDNQYIIKTMEEEDYNTIMSDSFMTYYLMHIDTYSEESLICRFYGIYTIKSEGNSKPFRLILMRNAMGPFKKLIRNTYDLKGSTMNREVNMNKSKKFSIESYFEVKKDVNFNKEIENMCLTNKKKFLDTIKNDAYFFEDLKIMDYSLFIFQIKYTDDVIFKLKDDNLFSNYSKYFFESDSNMLVSNVTSRKFDNSEDNSEKNDKDSDLEDDKDDQTINREIIKDEKLDNNKFSNTISSYQSSNLDSINNKKNSGKSNKGSNNQINTSNKNLYNYKNNNFKSFRRKTNINNEKTGYIIMIIDYLQKYTLNKQLEKNLKGVLKKGIASSAPPDEYCIRFINYCDQIS